MKTLIKSYKIMKKHLLFFIVAHLIIGLQTNAFAQMQGIINNSSEKVSRAISPEANTVKVKKYADSIMITLCRNTNSSRYCFAQTKLGSNTVEYAELPSEFKIYDFTIYKDEIYFCGNFNNQLYNVGFIAWANFNDLFNGGVFHYDRMQITKIVYELEVFYNNALGTMNIVALGSDDEHGNSATGTYFCIDYKLNSNTYDLYPTQNYILHTLTQTPTSVDVIFSENNTHARMFGVMRHMKNNMSNCQSLIWQYSYNGFDYTSGDARPQKRRPCFLAENIDDSELICVTTAIQSELTYSVITNHKINTFVIDVSSLQLLYTQVIPTVGKPILKDMKYNKRNKILNILANTSLDSIFNGCTHPVYGPLGCIDAIYELRPLITPSASSYSSLVIVPEDNIFLEVLNGIEIYDDRYYIVAGKSANTGTLYWFDRRYSTQNICYDRYTFNAHFEPTNPVGNMNYGYITHPKDVYTNTFIPYSTIYNTICLD